MAKKFPKHKVEINGDTWTVMLSDEETIHDIAGEPVHGLCVKQDRCIYIREDSVNHNVIMHEIIHAYTGYLHLDSATITQSNFEEIVCEFLPASWHKIQARTQAIFEALKVTKGRGRNIKFPGEPMITRKHHIYLQRFIVEFTNDAGARLNTTKHKRSKRCQKF